MENFLSSPSHHPQFPLLFSLLILFTLFHFEGYLCVMLIQSVLNAELKCWFNAQNKGLIGCSVCKISMRLQHIPNVRESHWISVQFSHSVVSDSATPWTAAHQASLSINNSWSSPSRWCHPTISSFVVPFSLSPQSLPASGSFQMSQLLASGGHWIGDS